MYDRVDSFTVCQPTPFIDHSPVKRWFNISPPTNNSFPEMTGIELNDLPKQFQWNSLPGGGGYSHTLPIRVCAAQLGRDFEVPALERGIHFRGVF